MVYCHKNLTSYKHFIITNPYHILRSTNETSELRIDRLVYS
jgi:hypothetical protein